MPSLRRKMRALIIFAVIGLFTGLFVLAGMTGAQMTTAQAQIASKFDVDGAIAQIKDDYRLFAAIFEKHPEAEREFRVAIMNAQTQEEAQTALLTISNRMVARYFTIYLPVASDDAIRNYLTHSLRVMDYLEKTPEKCAAYSQGRALAEGDLSSGLIKREFEVKAEIVESGIKAPVNRPKADEALLQAFREKYINAGNSADDFNVTKDFLAAIPSEACRQAMETTKAMLKLKPDETGRIYKNMLSSERNNP